MMHGANMKIIHSKNFVVVSVTFVLMYEMFKPINRSLKTCVCVCISARVINVCLHPLFALML